MSDGTGKTTLGFQAEVKQLLHLMIHSLYGNKEIFLRELISNASDACDKLRFEAIADGSLLGGEAELKMRVEYDKAAADHHRVGQRHRDVAAGCHRAYRHDRQIRNAGVLPAPHAGSAKDAQLIGQFGVGFYSSFIVADKRDPCDPPRGAAGRRRRVLGERRRRRVQHRDDPEGDAWDGRHPASAAGRGRVPPVGRCLADDPAEVLRPHHVSHRDEEGAVGADAKARSPMRTSRSTSASALWARPKSEITEEQYHEFYKHVGHDFEPPLA